MFKKRIAMSIFGVTVCGMAVGIMKTAALGVDPFQTVMSGCDQLIPLSFGTLYVLVNSALLIFSLIADRHNIGIATLLSLSVQGYVIQYTRDFLLIFFADAGMVVRVLLLIAGLLVMCFSSAFYMTADLGVSTYDAIAITMSGKWHIGPFKYVRICTDLVCITLGTIFYLSGGGAFRDIPTIVGMGTILTACCMGPLIDFFNRKIARPLLER